MINTVEVIVGIVAGINIPVITILIIYISKLSKEVNELKTRIAVSERSREADRELFNRLDSYVKRTCSRMLDTRRSKTTEE